MQPSHKFLRSHPLANLLCPAIAHLTNLVCLKTPWTAVHLELSPQLLSNSLFNHLQSGFWPNLSPKTTLTKVVNDLLTLKASRHYSVLILLELSPAFDTIDHSLLLQTVSSCGITDLVLSRISLYLANPPPLHHSRLCPRTPNLNSMDLYY